ncbi:MRL1 [Symbiodinium sp. CCMP2456]|nr:MRL1 [Symbiodinium sp. CCMP2456]
MPKGGRFPSVLQRAHKLSHRELLQQLKQRGTPEGKVVEIVALLRDQAGLSDVKDYTLAISALGRVGRWFEAVALYGEYSEQQGADGICHAAAVGACERSAQWVAALRLLQAGPGTLAPTAVAAALGACGKGRQWEHALACLRNVQVHGTKLSESCYGLAASACARSFQARSTLRLLQEAKECSLGPGVLASSAGLTACSKMQWWEQALVLFFGMQASTVPPDAVCHSTLVNCLGSAGRWQIALHLFHDALSALDDDMLGRPTSGDSLPLDVFVANAAMSACERSLQWQWALQLMDAAFSSRQLDFSPDTVTFNVALASWGQGRHWDRALLILDWMRDRDCPPDVVSFSAAISACERAGEWESALALLESMRRSTIRANATCYGAAIGAVRWPLATVLLQDMTAARLLPTTGCLNAAITSCVRSADWEHGLRLLVSMSSLKADFNIVSFNAAIAGCERGSSWELAMALLQEAFRHDPNAASCGAVIAACRRAAKWQSAVHLARSGMPAGSGACFGGGQLQPVGMLAEAGR